jgi:hypothetical protein
VDAIVFAAYLILTVALLVLVLWSGKRGLRRTHFTMAVSSIIALLLTIREAGLFGESFRFDATRLHAHLFFAVLSLLCMLGVVCTGLGLRTRVISRTAHRRWVLAFLSSLLLAFLSAGWMFGSAVRIGA